MAKSTPAAVALPEGLYVKRASVWWKKKKTCSVKAALCEKDWDQKRGKIK